MKEKILMELKKLRVKNFIGLFVAGIVNAIGVTFFIAPVKLYDSGISGTSIFMANAGGAWDNAKKYVEEGNFGGKSSDVHKATVVGDTVGDPFKDTSGPSLNILIKLMSMVAIVMAGLTVTWSIF